MPVRDAGYRCIAPDLPGFGRSDKPTDIDWYTYDRHTAALTALLEELDIPDATIVVHDWGGPIGLRAAVEPRTDLAAGHPRHRPVHRPSADDRRVDRVPGLRGAHRGPAGRLPRPRRLQARPGRGGDRRLRARRFPTPASKAGARAFPLILPTTPDVPGAEAGQRTLEALRDDPRPKLMLWADSDPVLPLETGQRFAAALGGEIAHVIADAGHFLQEDAGPQIGALIADWLRLRRPQTASPLDGSGGSVGSPARRPATAGEPPATGTAGGASVSAALSPVRVLVGARAAGGRG